MPTNIFITWDKGQCFKTVFTEENGQLLVSTTEPVAENEFATPELPGVHISFNPDAAWISLKELWMMIKPEDLLPAESSNPDWIIPVISQLWTASMVSGVLALHEAIDVLADDPAALFLAEVSRSMLFDSGSSAENHNPAGRIRRRDVEFDLDNMLRLIRPGGKLEQELQGYAYRPGQEQLITAIYQALEQENYLLAEAGTGVGKSLAYMIPAIFWAASSGEKVVISTKTRALQTQLVHKEIPLLEKVLPFEFIWGVAYGRSNYLCLSRYHRIKTAVIPDRKERRLLAGLILWLSRGGSGQLHDLRWESRDMAFWHLVNCQKTGCQGSKCQWFNSCYLNKARKHLSRCDVIIVNHALLLSDLVIENKLIPEYHYLVIDEAHNLEREAFDKLGTQFNIEDVQRVLRRLHDHRDRIARGYLVSLAVRHPELSTQIERLYPLISLTLESVDGLVQAITYEYGQQKNSFRIKPDGPNQKTARNCKEVENYLLALEHGLIDVTMELAGSDEESELRLLAAEINEKAQSVGLISEALERASNFDVIWAENDGGQISMIGVSPLDVGGRLGEELFQKMSSVILVSATLTVGGSFDYISGRIGVDRCDNDRIKTISVASPFDYKNNCRILIVDDIDEPGSSNFAAQVAQCIMDISEATDKRTLVLFTSKQLLLQVAGSLEDESGYWTGRIISQYLDGEHGTLRSNLESLPDGILLGSETFWEGIDLPGDLLNCLVITRLPFRAPNEPYSEAWLEYLARSGRNGFMEYTLPDAILRFRQGIGRLIRSEQDSGIVIILDRRILEPPVGKKYGRLFIQNMHAGEISEIKRGQIKIEVRRWFDR